MENGETFVGFDCVDNWAAQYASDTTQQVAQLGADIQSLRNQLLALAGYPNGVPNALPVRNNQYGVDPVEQHLIEGQKR